MADPGKAWNGPIGLAGSKYASPNRRREVAALLAANPELQAKKDAESIFAARKQTDVAKQPERNPNDVLQLAQAQKQGVEQEVARHTQEVKRTVSNAYIVTRQLLDMIRNSILKQCPDTADASLRTVGSIWTELETLCNVAQKAKDVVPRFMEKGREHTRLIVAAKVQETYDDYEQEPKRNYKQTELVKEQKPGQLQASKDVEAAYTQKNTEQQERLTRTLLDLGLLKEELSLTKDQLTTAKSAEQEALKLVEKLQKDADVLVQSKVSLAADNDRLCGALKDAEIKLKLSEEKFSEKYGKMIREVSEKLEKEQQKAAAVNKDLGILRKSQDTAKQELEKIKSEYNSLSDKYKYQSRAYGKLSEDLEEQTKKAKSLQTESLKLEQQKNEAEKQRDRANWLRETLSKQHAALKEAHEAELKQFKQTTLDKMKEFYAEMEASKEKNDALKKVNDELVMENDDFRAKLLQLDSINAANKKADAEIATLRATIQNMATPTTATSSLADTTGYHTELQKVQEELKVVKTEGDRWQTLATKAMIEYRALTERNKKYQDIEEQLAAAQAENNQLKAQGVAPPAGGDPDPDAHDATYWREKYQKLLDDTTG